MKNGQEINKILDMPTNYLLSILDESATSDGVADQEDPSAFNFLP